MDAQFIKFRQPETAKMSNHVGDYFKFCGLLRKPDL